ncbi:hypothetical protein AB0J63_44740 [Streptosporangium canum]|uniref:hypothetical protein n=1 Tax=Streptosporangium canum TaxID=324952 RepID=UPI00341974A8
MNLTRRHVLRLLGASAVAVPAAGLLVAAARDRVDTVGRVVLRSVSPADTRHTTEPADLTSEGRTTRAGGEESVTTPDAMI